MKVGLPKHGSGAGGFFVFHSFLLSFLLLLGTLYFASGPCNPLLYVMIMDMLDVSFCFVYFPLFRRLQLDFGWSF
jgi:hypothetical protein